MRTDHVMTRCFGESIPRHLVVFDTWHQLSRHPDNPRLQFQKLGGWKGVRYRIEGACCDQISSCDDDRGWYFFHWLGEQCRYNTQLWCIGYDIGRQLTLLGAWGLVESGDLVISDPKPQPGQPLDGAADHPFRGYLVTADPPVIMLCKLRGRPGTIRFVDIRNFMDEPLEMIGQELGVPSPHHLQLGVSVESCLVGCDWACEVLTSWCQQWFRLLREAKLGSAQSTLAAQALQAYRTNWLHPIIHCHTNDAALKLERESYFGGMCLAPYRGWVGVPGVQTASAQHGRLWSADDNEWGPVYELDVTSLYPYVAAVTSIPVALAGYTDQATLSQLHEKSEHFDVIAEVNLDTPHQAYPVRDGPSVTWATGRLRTVLACNELMAAIDEGIVTAVGRMAWYHTAQPFVGWANDLWQLRANYMAAGKNCWARMVKRLQNSLFGKFAQRAADWVDTPDVAPPAPFCTWWAKNPETEQLELFRAIGPLVQRWQQGGETENSCPAIASAVTAAGREHLRRLLALAGPKHWFYCDTDSLFVDSEGFQRLKNAGEVNQLRHGKLRLVRGHDSILFLAPKHYESEQVTVHAGVPDHAVQHGFTTWNWQAPLRLEAILAHGAGNTVVEVTRRMKIEQHPEEKKTQRLGWVDPVGLSMW